MVGPFVISVCPITLFHNAKKKKKKKEEEKKVFGWFNFPNNFRTSGFFIGFISWSYDFKSICWVKLCPSVLTKEFHWIHFMEL